MADIQLYAYADGTVRECDGWKAPNAERQNKVLSKAFSCAERFTFEMLDDIDGLHRVRLDYAGRKRDIAFINRSVCGGGRPASRPQELRVQIQPEVFNQIVRQNQSGGLGLLIGVYVIGEDAALAVWRPTSFSAGSGSASKQVDAEVVARAMQLGYEMQVYPDGETSIWVGKPELFLAYLDYLELAPPMTNSVQMNQRDENDEYSRNLICFGAPGTGKSYNLQQEAASGFDEDKINRVTFHPDYTYSQFVGSLRPHTDQDESGKTQVYYAYTPGPFIETYVDAIKNPNKDYLLIIEELNRANPAAVFGDVFQLLDRDNEGKSDYPVRTSDELHQYLANEFIALDNTEVLAGELSLPSNMYIWATMNSADQGVFPMDTAFKRRWDFRYMGINDGEHVISDKVVTLNNGKQVNWNTFRRGINNVLLDARVNEDKLLGPFFIDPFLINDEDFNETFKSKVLLYLIEDAAKTKKEKVFDKGNVTYSVISGDFDVKGTDIFSGIGDIAIDATTEIEEDAASDEIDG